MRIDFDPIKSARNQQERNLPFSRAEHFDWVTAVYTEDTRFDYPEQRIVALGLIGTRVHVICFTPIDGGVRVISMRKANAREVRRYEKTTDG